MLNMNPIMEMVNSNNGLHRQLSKSRTIPTIQLELDDVIDESINESNNGITKRLTIPTIRLEVDEALDDRKCSPFDDRKFLFPENKSEPLRRLSTRKKRESSFSTFQIIDENNCGM